MVTKQGELVYEFVPGLVRRDAEALSQRLYAWARPLLQLLWRGFTVGFKIWIAATLVVYTIVFAVLGIALMLAGEGDNDGPGYLLWWLLPDFGPRRDEDAWTRRRRLAGPERPRKRFHRSVFDFVFGTQCDAATLDGIFTCLASGLEDLADLLTCLPAGRQRSAALKRSLRAVARIGGELCGSSTDAERNSPPAAGA